MMNVRLWFLLGLPVLASLLAAPEAHSQPRNPWNRGLSPSDYPAQREHPSHRPIGEGIGLDSAEGVLARLQSYRQIQDERKQKDLDDALKQLTQFLSRNPGLLESFQKQMRDREGMPLDALVRQFLADDKLPDRWRDHVQRWLEANPNLDRSATGRLLEQFNREAKRNAPGSNPNAPDPPGHYDPPDNQPPTPRSLPPRSSPPGEQATTWLTDLLSPQSADWVKNNLDRWVDSLDDWLETPDGQGWRDTLRDLANRGLANPRISPDLAEKVRGLSRYLPRLDALKGTTRLPDPHLPTLPRPPAVTVPSWSASVGMPRLGRGEGAGPLVLLVLFGIVAVVLSRFALRHLRERLAAASGEKLGPWPVRPQAVTTSEQLVRAFEYLAVLSLGMSARPRHHLELADDLARLPDLDPLRRTEAVRFLVGLYEQARYAPEGLPLPEELLPRIRRELSYLAGVPAV
jgi:hypothetical protein